MKRALFSAVALLAMIPCAAAQAQDALTTQTLTEVCFPELIDQTGREPDLLMVSSAAYGLDYNQNIDADLSASDVLYKRAPNGIYHLDIGGDRKDGFYCAMTLPPSVTLDAAKTAVDDLLDGADGWSSTWDFDPATRLDWFSPDRSRIVAVEILPEAGPVRITVAYFPPAAE